jgi:hypothetical protein
VISSHCYRYSICRALTAGPGSAGNVTQGGPARKGYTALSDGFSVDLAALADAAGGINGLLAELNAHQLNDVDCDQSAVGHDKLAGSTKDFCDR